MTTKRGVAALLVRHEFGDALKRVEAIVHRRLHVVIEQVARRFALPRQQRLDLLPPEVSLAQLRHPARAGMATQLSDDAL